MRRVVGLVALLVLGALLLGIYGRFIRTPPPPPPSPEVIDSGTPLATEDEFERLARTDPVAMYEQCLLRYQREVKNGLIVTLVKKERIQGHPQPPAVPREEVITLFVRGDVPDPVTRKECIEVLMKWQSGMPEAMLSKLHGSLYSEKAGKDGTGGKVTTWRPDAVIASTNSLPITDTLAKGLSRYCIRDAGIYRGMLRTYDAWKQRKEAGTLKTEYLGKKAIPEADGRVCYIIERHCPSPEADPFQLGDPPVTDAKIIAREGFTRVRVMIDAETHMQIGTELYRPDGQLLAAYYFRNPNTNPTFDPDTFTVSGLKKK